tara:strand:+ start:1079 stop:2047 length:969 start_codon:yes stop_codon:yes gene_type:complete
MTQSNRHLKVIDSHTAGEPTRVVLSGGPELTGNSVAEKRAHFEEVGHWVRTACINEPRGFDAIVGAYLCESERSDCVTGVIFFNNAGCLPGCVHGTIGVAVTLAHLGLIEEGTHGFETPSGVVQVTLKGNGVVSVQNVRSYRHATDVILSIPDFGEVRGDVAWGGNWCYLTEADDRITVDFKNLKELTHFSSEIRRALRDQGVTGKDGIEVDHIEVFGPPSDLAQADSKNFVLCPGLAYDRSPCGTGTSAKLACLYESGILKAGQNWRQAGILDTVFEGSFEVAPEGGIIPTMTGSAFITAESELHFNSDDPFTYGINAPLS